MLKSVTDEFDELNKLAVKAANFQQQSYNEWAMDRLQKAFREGIAEVGYIYNEKRKSHPLSSMTWAKSTLGY